MISARVFTCKECVGGSCPCVIIAFDSSTSNLLHQKLPTDCPYHANKNPIWRDDGVLEDFTPATLQGMMTAFKL